MSCSICGKSDHNARTCPSRQNNEKRDYALWVKFDNLTLEEADDLQGVIIKDKSRIAPNARGTAAKGKKSDLPKRIQDALKLSEGKNGSKKGQ